MRVLWLIDSLTAGGAEALTAAFARARDPEGIELHVCALKSLDGNPHEAELRELGVPVTNLGARTLRDLRALARLRRLVRRTRPDLVHAHLAYAILWACLAVRDRPVVATLHTPPGTRTWRSREGWRQALLSRALRRRCARVVAVSEALRRAYVEAWSLPADRVEVVPNGVELDRFRPLDGAARRALRAELGIPAAAPLVTTVAVLRPGKGIEVLLEAAARLAADVPAARFLVVGDGPLRGVLERRAAAADLGERVRWLGHRGDVPRLLAASDLFVHPSLADAYPTALLEAMAAGLPALASAVGGVPEILGDPPCGVLVPPGDAEALAAALRGLLADAEGRAELGRRARRRAEEALSARAWAQRLEALYRRVAAKPVGPTAGRLPPRASLGGAEAADRSPAPAPERPSVAASAAEGSALGLAPDAPRGLRIAVVEPAGRGGLVHYAFQLCRALAAEGAEPVLFTSHDYELAALPHAFRVEPILRLWDPKPPPGTAEPGPLRRRLRRAGRGIVHYREWARLIRRLARDRPDLVQLGDIRFPGDLTCVAALRLLGLPVVDVCHNVRPFALAGAGAGAFRTGAIGRRAYRAAYRLCHHVFVHYPSNRERFRDTYSLPEERVTAIPHGNEELFAELREPGLDGGALRRELGLEPEAQVLLLFGTLSRYKGADLLLDAFARVHAAHPRARLVLAGHALPDFDAAAWRRRADELGLAAAVRLVSGYVPAGRVAAWMELATIAVFPYREIFQSGALMIAQTFGVPTVASRVGALPEAVVEDETALLVPPGDAEALGAALARLLGDEALRERLGRAAREHARTAASWRSIAQSLLARYERLAPVRASSVRRPPAVPDR